MAELPGFFDFDADRLALMRATSAKLVDVFGTHGYQRVEPPVVDWSSAFLERSGEGIRGQVYMFEDPRGRELCLRPELTIPVCRLLLRSDWSRDNPARLCYSGPAFRYDPHGRNNFRQFHQAGVEFIGDTESLAAEAEIMALAHDAVVAAGVADFRIKLGDVRFFLELLNHYPLPETLKTQLRRSFFRASGLSEILGAAMKGEQKIEPLSAEQEALVTAIGDLGRDKAAGFIRSFLSVADINFIGTRSIDEIVERLVDTSLDRLSGLPADIAAQIHAFLAIGGPPHQALGEIRDFAKEVGLGLAPLIDACEQRIALLEAYGIDENRLWLGTAQKRDIEYYTGLVFEIVQDKDGEETALGGGGRYDQLVNALEPSLDLPAIGFALTLERLMMAAEPDVFNQRLSIRPPVDAHISTADPSTTAATITAAQTLRAAGWRVSLSLDPRSTGRAKPAARFDIAITEGKNGTVTVQIADGTTKDTRQMPIGELAGFARGLKL